MSEFSVDVRRTMLAGATMLMFAMPAVAAPGHHGGHAQTHGFPFGEAAEAAAATRTVTITMRDNFFEPDRIEVQAGEIVRFVVRNEGAFLHEFALGRPQDHERHQSMMQQMWDHGMITPTGIDHEKMKMDHSAMGMDAHQHGPETGSILIDPGKSGEIVWKFAGTSSIEFACTVPGHYEAGMVGDIDIAR